MHLLTALLLRSGVKSSSAILTQPRDLTANLIGFSESRDGRSGSESVFGVDLQNINENT